MRETISYYRIVRQLGRGGMGEVYLAEDTRLHRMVALKVLTPEFAREPRRVQRFLREAHAASALNHPNIAVIHEIGESEDSTPFIAMEYVEGQTLDEMISSKPLETKRIVELGMEIADALDEAQAKGIVHRDLKPSNIIINTRGHAKVLDFGLAKVTEKPSADAGAATDLKSDPGLVLGTVHYMSPEQALGKEVDHRSDLFSFGVVLYEMATAQHPFGSGSVTAIIERIVHNQPDSVARLNYEVPPELERIIRKCLEKDREWRYQSAREIVVDLKSLRRDSESGERVRTAPAERKPRMATATIAIVAFAALLLGGLAVWALRKGKSADAPVGMTTIAVLPFSSLASNPSVDHLRFALPDEVTTILSYNPSIAVRPFSSTRRLADTDPVEAGRTLNVEKVITGHYSSDRAGLGVTLEAIDVGSNRVVWRNNIAIPSAELISLRNALSTQVRAGLLPALGVAERGTDMSRPTNPEAYALYLKAVGLSTDLEPSRQARALLEQAVALDPNYASAWSELGRRHYFEANYGGGGKKSITAARSAVRRALALDPEYVQAARSLVIYDTEVGDLSNAYRQAMELARKRPRSSDAHFCVGYVLRYGGRLKDAARECEIAYSLDPSYGLRSCALVFMHLGNYQRARDFLRLDEGSEWTNGVLFSILVRENKITEAKVLLPKIPDRYVWGATLLSRCIGNRKVGPKELAQWQQDALLSLDSESMFFAAAEMSFCGETDEALRLLRKSLQQGYAIHPPIDTDPLFESLRRDPRFPELRAAAIGHREKINAEFLQIERSSAP